MCPNTQITQNQLTELQEFFSQFNMKVNSYQVDWADNIKRGGLGILKGHITPPLIQIERAYKDKFGKVMVIVKGEFCINTFKS